MLQSNFMVRNVELLPILIAAAVWGREWKSKWISSDNMAVAKLQSGLILQGTVHGTRFVACFS